MRYVFILQTIFLFYTIKFGIRALSIIISRNLKKCARLDNKSTENCIKYKSTVRLNQLRRAKHQSLCANILDLGGPRIKRKTWVRGLLFLKDYHISLTSLVETKQWYLPPVCSASSFRNIWNKYSIIIIIRNCSVRIKQHLFNKLLIETWPTGWILYTWSLQQNSTTLTKVF